MKDSVAQFNGGIPIAAAAPFSRIVSIPINVISDKCQLSLRNIHATAEMCFKWVMTGSSTNANMADCGIRLSPGMGFTVEIVKPEMDLIGQSSVAGAVCAVDFVAKLQV